MGITILFCVQMVKIYSGPLLFGLGSSHLVVQFFAGGFCLIACLRMTKLARTGLQFPSCCSNCSKHVENNLHLFLQCDYAKQLWSVVGSAFNVSLSLHGSIEDFVIQCMGLKINHYLK